MQYYYTSKKDIYSLLFYRFYNVKALPRLASSKKIELNYVNGTFYILSDQNLYEVNFKNNQSIQYYETRHLNITKVQKMIQKN